MSLPPAFLGRGSDGFLSWLRQESWTERELLDWCYFGFGRGRGADTPHEQLQSVLPRGAESFSVRIKLAERIAAVLSKWPDLSIPYPGFQKVPENLLYDLFSLASFINCPAVLFQPLWTVRQRLLEKNLRLPELAQVGLAKALIYNQGIYNSEMLAVWQLMTQAQVDPILGGSPALGMEGIGMMPGQLNSQQPENSAIGEALLSMARIYANNISTRRQQFRSHVLWIRDVWGLQDEYFISLADTHKWVEDGHEWAVAALPDLFVTNFGEVSPPGQQHCALVWYWFAECIKPFTQIDIQKKICGGTILQVRFSIEASKLFDSILRQIKGLAKFEPDISEIEANLYVNELMKNIVQYMREAKNPIAAKKIAATQAEFEKTHAIAF